MLLNKIFLLNKLLLAFGKLSHHRYHSSLCKVETIQSRKLMGYIHNNANTIYGKQFNFRNIKDYASFAAQVPIIEEWKQLENYIERIEKGEKNIFFADEIDGFEETSGSTGFSKLIPYNKKLKREFQIALQVWMYDLYREFPNAFAGKAYWSLSPVLKEKRFSDGGIRVGLENDAEYFNPFIAYVLSKTMAVSPELIKINSSHTFYFETLKQLLLEKNLSFISVWSPTFFLQLNEFLQSNLVALLQAVAIKSEERAEEVRKITEKEFSWKSIWPKLACISCWTDAQAAMWLNSLKLAAGNVPIQPKGLLSTEAVITIPIKDCKFPALAYYSHFFEFRNVGDRKIFLAHQLQINNTYEVIVTTAGGLYRYLTKDVVQVKGFNKQVPLLQFVGRSSRTSDLVGEKVSELQVNEIVNDILREFKTDWPVMFLKPAMVQQSAVYVLYIQANKNVSDAKCEEIKGRFHDQLCKNPYYRQALNSGQLKVMKYKSVPENFLEQLINYYKQNRLIKEGDIKVPALFLYDELSDLNFFS